MYRLMSFHSRSALLRFTGGRYLAEQCMINWDDSINPILLRSGNEVKEQDVAYQNLHRIENPYDIVIGENWDIPINQVHIYEATDWSRFPIHDANGQLYKYIYPMARLASIILGPKKDLRLTPRPGDRPYNVEDIGQLRHGQKVQVTWETIVPGRGPHPNRLVSLPIPGPLAYGHWERAEDLALQIQYDGATDGKSYMQYIKIQETIKKPITENMSPVAKVLAMLENWRWTSGVPDWITRSQKCRVHDFDYDFFERVWRCTRLRGPAMSTPQLIGGGNSLGPQAFQLNHAHIQHIIGSEWGYLIGDPEGATSTFCELEHWGRTREPECASQPTQLP
ncbi:hypothetical protein PG994_001521 [Apiospora phragmitis]|uniref:Uncharacterized protein n=1 Tax=Apiospora phragmitis TaxID=2905665 RepID=A0ABR1WTU2_9PEZI